MADSDERIVDFISGKQVRSTPEEIQAVQPFSKILVDDYGYPKSHIQTRPQWHVKVRPSDTKKEYPVDIAVFSGPNHCDDSFYIVVECKKKNRKDGRTQLEDYSAYQKRILAFGTTAKNACTYAKSKKTARCCSRRYRTFPAMANV